MKLIINVFFQKFFFTEKIFFVNCFIFFFFLKGNFIIIFSDIFIVLNDYLFFENEIREYIFKLSINYIFIKFLRYDFKFSFKNIIKIL